MRSSDPLCRCHALVRARTQPGLSSRSAVALERVREFTELPNEPTDGLVPPVDWPRASAPLIAIDGVVDRPMIEFEDVYARYAPHLPLVMRGVTLSIRAGGALVTSALCH